MAAELKGLPINIVKHGLSEEELSTEFPSGYRKLKDEIYNKLEYHPAWFEVKEHHLDNNLAEQAIMPFTVGRNNWKLIDPVHGAKTSAIIYSLVETAKANKLKPYYYLKHVLT